jgi:hypothetical protein
MTTHRISETAYYINLTRVYNLGRDISEIGIPNEAGNIIHIQPDDKIELLNPLMLKESLPKGLLPNKTTFTQINIKHPETVISDFNHSVKGIARFQCEVKSISKDAFVGDTLSIVDSQSPLTFECENIGGLSLKNCPNVTFHKNFTPSGAIQLDNSGKGIIDLNSKYKLSIDESLNITEIRGSYHSIQIRDNSLKIEATVKKVAIIIFKEGKFPQIGKNAAFEDFSLMRIEQKKIITNPEETIELFPVFSQMGFPAKQHILGALAEQNAVKAALSIGPKDFERLLRGEGDPNNIKFLHKIEKLRQNMGTQKNLIEQALNSPELNR